MPSIVDTIVHAHDTVRRRVEDALHTQLGDRARLQEHQREALQLLEEAIQVRLPLDECRRSSAFSKTDALIACPPVPPRRNRPTVL